MSPKFSLISRLASVTNGLVGCWIMISPASLGFAAQPDSDTWLSFFIGATVMTFAMIRVSSPENLSGLSWANLALGSCVFLSAWMLRIGADGPRFWTHVAGGLIIMLFAFSSAGATYLTHKGALRSA